MVAFTLAGKELEAADRFKRAHEEDHGPDRSVSGGRFSFTFTPTGIGTAVTVECACGAKHDCTDYDSW